MCCPVFTGVKLDQRAARVLGRHTPVFVPFFKGFNELVRTFKYHVPMASITTAEAQAYSKRWELLKEIELAELRSTSIDTKLRQLSALMASRSLFGADPEREGGIQLVRDRWARHWQVLGG
jgi:hypothetical protein